MQRISSPAILLARKLHIVYLNYYQKSICDQAAKKIQRKTPALIPWRDIHKSWWAHLVTNLPISNRYCTLAMSSASGPLMGGNGYDYGYGNGVWRHPCRLTPWTPWHHLKWFGCQIHTEMGHLYVTNRIDRKRNCCLSMSFDAILCCSLLLHSFWHCGRIRTFPKIPHKTVSTLNICHMMPVYSDRFPIQTFWWRTGWTDTFPTQIG